jgi:mono/diheme cytochrome c family protein
MPRALTYTLLILLVLAMIPPALIARTRAVNSPAPRIQFMYDMGVQARFEPQSPNPLFADRRAMRPQVPGTVARGDVREDDHYYRGRVDGGWAMDFPQQKPLTMELMHRGQERYDIYCAVCHGSAGWGDGMVHRRGAQLTAAGIDGTVWTPPTSLHDPRVKELPVGQLFHVITHGIGGMAPYGHLIPPEDRWAIVAYVLALQRSQDARPEDIAGN